MENTKIILDSIRTVLNGDLVQGLFGDQFELMDQEQKASFMICCMYQIAKDNSEIMELLATDAYNELRK